MANGYAVAKTDQFKEILNTPMIRAQIKNCLKDNANSFMSSMLDLYMNDKNLQTYEPSLIVAECLKAASLKLPIVKSLGFAYVVPYKNKPTFTIGYKGLIQLAQRTGLYRYINADNVYEGELKGFNKLNGSPNLTGERTSDVIVGYFSYIKLNSGFEKALYMTKDEVTAWAMKYSPSFNSSFTPWKTEFDKMAQKTVLRRLIGTYGALSIEMTIALDMDDKGSTPQQEIKDNANRGEIIDVSNIIDSQATEPNQSEPVADPQLNGTQSNNTPQKTEHVQQSLPDPGF